MINNSGIYKITSKEHPDRIYIGSTIRLNRRGYEHLYALKQGAHDNKKLQNHFNKYGLDDLEYAIVEAVPIMDLEIISEFEDRLTGREQHYLDTLNPWFNINKVANSMLGYHHTNETKRILSIKHTGKKMPTSVKNKISIANKGRKCSDDTIQKLKDSWIDREVTGMTGKSHSDDTKLKMRLSHLGKPMSDETKNKLSEIRKGRTSNRKGAVLSAETKLRISVANKGRVPWISGKTFSAESKLKMSLSHIGQKSWNKGMRGVYKPSEETKLKQSESIKKVMEGRSPWNKGLRGVLSEETIERMRVASTGRLLSDYSKAKISLSKKGKVSWHKGRKKSPEAIAKMMGHQAHNKNKKRIYHQNGGYHYE